MRKVTELVLADFSNLLEWFGIPGHIHSEYTPMALAQTLTDFAKDVQEANVQLSSERNQARILKNWSAGSMRRSHSSLDLRMKPIVTHAVQMDDQNNFSSSLENVLELALAEKKRQNESKRVHSKKVSLVDIHGNLI